MHLLVIGLQLFQYMYMWWMADKSPPDKSPPFFKGHDHRGQNPTRESTGADKTPPLLCYIAFGGLFCWANLHELKRKGGVLSAHQCYFSTRNSLHLLSFHQFKYYSPKGEWAVPGGTAIPGQPVGKSEQAPASSPKFKNQFNIVDPQWGSYQILSW